MAGVKGEDQYGQNLFLTPVFFSGKMAVIPDPAAGRRGPAAAGRQKKTKASECEDAGEFHHVE